jgi:hypothetical protein
MSDEPLFCTVCGAEDFACDHDPRSDHGPYCEVCGIVPAAGKECHFYKKSGRPQMCEGPPQGP